MSPMISPPPGFRGRHYEGKPPEPSVWHCPACGAEQTGQLEAGCQACGSGTNSAKHVGVAPVAPKQANDGPAFVAKFTAPEPPLTKSSEDLAWSEWIRIYRSNPNYVSPVVYEAFVAGYRAGLMAVRTVRTSTSTDSHEAPPVDLPLAGSAESRTLVAALKFFREQVLSAHPEEVTTGEWLTLEEVDALIARLEVA